MDKGLISMVEYKPGDWVFLNNGDKIIIGLVHSFLTPDVYELWTPNIQSNHPGDERSVPVLTFKKWYTIRRDLARISCGYLESLTHNHMVLAKLMLARTPLQDFKAPSELELLALVLESSETCIQNAHS